jgi:NADH:ubiquinone oxidoreductase subunit 4 (subunit M)
MRFVLMLASLQLVGQAQGGETSMEHPTLYRSIRERAFEMVEAQVLSCGGVLVLAVLAMLLIWLGVYPSPLLDLIRASLVGLN